MMPFLIHTWLRSADYQFPTIESNVNPFKDEGFHLNSYEMTIIETFFTVSIDFILKSWTAFTTIAYVGAKARHWKDPLICFEYILTFVEESVDKDVSKDLVR